MTCQTRSALTIPYLEAYSGKKPQLFGIKKLRLIAGTEKAALDLKFAPVRINPTDYAVAAHTVGTVVKREFAVAASSAGPWVVVNAGNSVP
jgi:hypothetical protein